MTTETKKRKYFVRLFKFKGDEITPIMDVPVYAKGWKEALDRGIVRLYGRGALFFTVGDPILEDQGQGVIAVHGQVGRLINKKTLFVIANDQDDLTTVSVQWKAPKKNETE